MAKYKKWTDDEVRMFIELYPTAPWDDLTELFQLSKGSLAQKASVLGLKRLAKQARYTEEEDGVIQQLFVDGHTDEDIACILGNRSASSIKSRRQALRCITRERWSQEEDEVFANLYHVVPIDELLDVFPNRTREALIHHGVKLGIQAWMPYRDYTDEDERFIIEHYKTMSDEEIGNIIGRSKDSIKNRRNKLGCHRFDGDRSHYDDVALYVRRHNQDWKNRSMRNCGYKCVITGERFSAIHHLKSQNAILRDVMRTLGINPETFNINRLSSQDKDDFMNAFYIEQDKYPLGVCLKQDIHHKFHVMYGFGDNTPEQFDEFVSVEYPNRQLHIA